MNRYRFGEKPQKRPDDELETEFEKRLINKFNDYVNLEKKMSKQNFLGISDNVKPGKFGKRFIISGMAQGAIITGLTIALLLNQIAVFNGNISNIFEFAFIDNFGLFFFGFILQIGLTAVLTIFGLFYNHMETNLEKGFSRFTNILSWIHLIGVNVFGNVITMSLMFSGIAASALYQSSNSYVFNLIPSMFYISTILLLTVIVIGVIGTGANFLKNKLQSQEN